MKKKKLYFWIDRFERGGLEKSIFELYKDLKERSLFKKIIVCSLITSKNSLQKYSTFDSSIELKFYKNHWEAYFSLFRFIKTNNLIISFKNHVPFIVFLLLKNTSLQNLILRHSSSVLSSACLNRYNKSDSFVNKYRQRLRFRIQNYFYSLVPNHFCNSLENMLLLELFVRQNVFCYTNKCYLEKYYSDSYINKSNIINNKSYKAIWFARYSSIKDINVLCESLTEIDSIGNKVELDIYTSNIHLMRKNIYRNLNSDLSNIIINFFNWSDNLDIKKYDIAVITSFHEGLSNSFMESITANKFILAPLTSSGFLENITSKVYLYRPSNSKSFVFTFTKLFDDTKNNKHVSTSAMQNQHLYNQEFFTRLKYL